LTNLQRVSRIIAAIVAILVPGVAFFTQLATIGFIGPDEPRYAWIARAMAQTHDWITPRLYGQPWFEKPALYYWLAGIGFKLLKSGEIAARLPSALAALLAAAAIAWFALQSYGARPAWLAIMVFSTTGGVIAFSHAATPDMLFAACITWTMVCASAVLRDEGVLRASNEQAVDATAGPKSPVDAKRMLAYFGAWLGAATLAKGPAAIVLAGGGMCLWSLCTQRWSALKRFVQPVPIAAFAIVALPWYAICAIRNPGFLRTFLFLHNFERYVTPVFQHQQPFWFFGPVFLMALLPWTILLVPVIGEGWRVARGNYRRDSIGCFLTCWIVFIIAFFSVSQSKLPSYILPAIPAAALLMAIAFDRWISKAKWPVRYLLVLAGLMLWILLFYAVHQFAVFIPDYFSHEIRAFEVLVFFLVSTTPFLTPPRIGTGMLAAAILFVLSVTAIAFSIKTPPLSPRPLVPSKAWFVAHKNESITVYRVNRFWEYGLNFYLGKELPEWSPDVPGVSLVYTTPDGLREISEKAAVEDYSLYGIPTCVKTEVVVMPQ
jgi:4-amino-4-deoxy-L-arabinose transferase-like glycosyltransferase